MFDPLSGWGGVKPAPPVTRYVAITRTDLTRKRTFCREVDSSSDTRLPNNRRLIGICSLVVFWQCPKWLLIVRNDHPGTHLSEGGPIKTALFDCGWGARPPGINNGLPT